MSTGDHDMSLMKSHVAALGEHFDSVQIFCTRHDTTTKGTVNCHYGSGDWFSRFGHVRAWIIAEEKDMKLNTESNDFPI